MKKKNDLSTSPFSVSPVSRRAFLKFTGLTAGALTIPGFLGCAPFKPRRECLARLAQKDARVSSDVFSPVMLGPIQARNRIVRSATTLGLATENGGPLDELIETYTALCEGGVGAIITGAAGVQQNGKLATPLGYMIHQDDLIPAYRRLTNAVHKHDTPVIMQIAHGGRQTRRAITGETPVAPSPVTDPYYDEETPKELTEQEIYGIIDSFAEAAERARKAGFDGVQLHAAHGYLLSGFLSPATNRRTDKWGGSTENRFRIIREIYAKTRKRVGRFPIIVKMNAYDHQPDGMRTMEAATIARMLEEEGCDAIEVSCGMAADGFSTIRVTEIPSPAILKFSYKYKDNPYLVKKALPLFAPMIVNRFEPIFNYNVCAAQTIKQNVQIPVIVVGGIRTRADIEHIIGEQMADFVAMSRPFIIEPDIVDRFRNEHQAESECINCGYCLIAVENEVTRCFYGEIS